MSATTATPEIDAPSDAPMSHRQILEALAGLLAGLFTAMLSSTIVATALPTIIGDLNGTQHQYTWVITAALLATTVTTPIWGKLSDLFNKKALVQISLLIFVGGSVAAGFSQDVPFLIACRVIQGIGMGGLTALVQSIIGVMIPPRERGKYAGYMGAVMAVATVSGPLLGGLIVDTALGWRWTFYVCVPLAVIALFILQRTLNLPTIKRKPKIDYLGAILIAITASLPLLWVTFAGNEFDWWSTETGLYLGGTAVALILTVIVELRAAEPIIPLRLMKNANTVLVVIATLAVGLAMFGGATFLTQYFQIARGYTPTKAGLLTIPLMAALLVTSTIAGQIVSRTGKWKVVMSVGSFALVGGLFWLGTLDHQTPMWQVWLGMVFMGIGVGSMMQNLVLVVQNSVDVTDIGAISASVAFFRTLGGAIGVSALGAVLANGVQDKTASGLQKLGGPYAEAAAQGGGSGSGSLDLASMPEPVREIVRAAYGDATGTIFWIGAFVAIASVICILFMREVPLRTTIRKTDDTPALVPAGAGTELAVDPAAEPIAVADATPVRSADSSPVGTLGGGNAVEPDNDAQLGDAQLDDAQPIQSSAVTQAGRSSESDDGFGGRQEMLALAALDVLAAAEDRVNGLDDVSARSLGKTKDLIRSLRDDVDTALGQFHAGLGAVMDELDNPPQGRHSDNRDQPRDLEYSLLVTSQQSADRIISAAHSEAETIVARARLQAGRDGGSGIDGSGVAGSAVGAKGTTEAPPSSGNTGTTNQISGNSDGNTV